MSATVDVSALASTDVDGAAPNVADDAVRVQFVR